jgi:hypothetical protein
LTIFGSVFGFFSLAIFVWFSLSLEGGSLACRNGVLPVSGLYFSSALFLFDRVRGKKGSFGPTGIDSNRSSALQWITFIAAFTAWSWAVYWMFTC